MKRSWTIPEVEQATPYLQRITRDLASCYARVMELRPSLDPDAPYDPIGVYETLIDRLGRGVDELHELGGELRDVEGGVIHFVTDDATRWVRWSLADPRPTLIPAEPAELTDAERQQLGHVSPALTREHLDADEGAP